MRENYETKPSSTIHPTLPRASIPVAGGVPWYVEALLLLALGVLVLQTLAFAYPARGHLPGCDSGNFLYAGSRVLQGELPYRDVWDHKPPGIFYVDALGLLIGDGSGWGVWTLQLLALGGAAALGYALMRRLFGPLVAALTSIACVARLPLLVGNGNLIEEYALPLQWLALWLFFRAESRGRYTWEGYAIGLSGALAFLLRQNLISAWLAIGLYLALRAAWRRDWRQLQPLAPMVAAGAGTLLAVLAYFAARGVLPDLWDAAFRYNFAYSEAGPGDLLAGAWVGLRLFPGLVALALAGWLARLRDLLWRRDSLGVAAPLMAVCALGFPLEVALSGLSGHAYPHYYTAWLPFCALLAGGILKPIERDLRACWAGGLGRRGSGLRAKRLVCTGTAAIILPLMLVAQFSVLPFADPWARPGHSPYADVAEYVRETTAESDTVLVWGMEATINFMAERRSPTRLVFQNALFRGIDYQATDMVEEFLAGIEAAKPALIIDTSPKDIGVPPLDATARAERLREPHDFVLLPEMDEVFSYVAEHYRPERTFAGLGWVAYRYVGSD